MGFTDGHAHSRFPSWKQALLRPFHIGPSSLELEGLASARVLSVAASIGPEVYVETCVVQIARRHQWLSHRHNMDFV